MHRKELLEQYLLRVLQVQMAERVRGRALLVKSANQYLDSADPQQRLSEPIVAIFSTNICERTSLDFAAARNVFSIMEKYVINLLDCPWKREFRKITMYSGFYKTQIEPSLKDAWKLLQLVGYEKVGMCLELTLLLDVRKLQNVAFEFYLASLECTMYNNVFQKISHLMFTMKDFHQCRQNFAISSDELFKALSHIYVNETIDERESGRTNASSRVKDYLSLLSGKNPECEAKFGSEVRVSGAQSESGQQQVGSASKVAQLPESEKEGNACEPRSESIEALLRDITPEMISDSNVRRQIMAKLTSRPQSAKSQDEHIHASLPLHQVQREGDLRPYTEPLLIPKQPKPGVTSASDLQPYSQPLAIFKQPKTGVISTLEARQFTEPLSASKQPKIDLQSTSGTRQFTKPLLLSEEPRTGLQSALDVQPLPKRPPVPKQCEYENKVLPNLRPYTESLIGPKQTLRPSSASDQRPWTEPLLVPLSQTVSSKRISKLKEPVLSHWRCQYCFYSNITMEYAEKCVCCGMARKAF